jgi:hypothetical protein
LLFEQVVRAPAGTSTGLSWGGRPMVAPGWINADRVPGPGVDLPGDRAGFRDVGRCRFGRTASAHADIVGLDSRERESLFVEATR